MKRESFSWRLNETREKGREKSINEVSSSQKINHFCLCVPFCSPGLFFIYVDLSFCGNKLFHLSAVKERKRISKLRAKTFAHSSLPLCLPASAQLTAHVSRSLLATFSIIAAAIPFISFQHRIFPVVLKLLGFSLLLCRSFSAANKKFARRLTSFGFFFFVFFPPSASPPSPGAVDFCQDEAERSQSDRAKT